MISNFDRAVSFTLNMEGGTNFNVDDRGGLTNFGISQKQYPVIDISNLTKSMARQIYYDDYWVATKCNRFDSALSLVMFDTAVNCGVHSAKVWLQAAVGANVDGIIGVKTISACESISTYCVCCKILGLRLKRYVKLIKRKPNQRIFILGWVTRVYKILDVI